MHHPLLCKRRPLRNRYRTRWSSSHTDRQPPPMALADAGGARRAFDKRKIVMSDIPASLYRKGRNRFILGKFRCRHHRLVSLLRDIVVGTPLAANAIKRIFKRFSEKLSCRSQSTRRARECKSGSRGAVARFCIPTQARRLLNCGAAFVFAACPAIAARSARRSAMIA